MKLALRRLLAFLLSWVCPGLGQYYAGRPARACLALAVWLVVFMPVAVQLPLFVAWGRWSILSSMALAIVLQFIVPLDAARCVRVSAEVGTSRTRRWAIGIAFTLVALTLVYLEPEWLRTHVPRRLSKVPSPAMVPAIRDGDFVVFERHMGLSQPVAPGEIVVVSSTDDPPVEYVKRVVAGPGSTVEVREGRLILDGEERTAAPGESTPSSTRTETLGGRTYTVHVKGLDPVDCVDWGPERVPEGAYFLLGDNRCKSVDSRDWGPAPATRLHGRVLRIQWSEDPATGKVRWSRLGIDLTTR